MNPYPIQVFKNIGITFIPSKKVYNAALYLHNDLPTNILEKISKIPGIGTSSFKKNVKQLKMVNAKSRELGEMFDHFTSHSWTYESV